MGSRDKLVAHVVVGIEKRKGLLRQGDIVDGILVLAEILERKNKLQYRVNESSSHAVSLNFFPSPNASGHMRSMRKVTRKKLIFSWSTKMSTVLYNDWYPLKRKIWHTYFIYEGIIHTKTTG
jgi:hypothetical protein